ncbi:hypothetical protein N0824_03391 [Microcystis sp. 0824]|nr:hypothetical protein N0824_03391 [Microcystis sp. 0824]
MSSSPVNRIVSLSGSNGFIKTTRKANTIITGSSGQVIEPFNIFDHIAITFSEGSPTVING